MYYLKLLMTPSFPIEMIQIILLCLFIILSAYFLVCGFYYLFQERLIFVPALLGSESTDFVLASDYEEIYLDGSVDGKLHAILIKGRESRGCILYFHGNTGSMRRWAPIAEELTSFGFDVLLPDYRGYGKSKGFRTEETLLNDTSIWYNYISSLYPVDKICIYGRSLGTAMAAWLSARVKVGGVILETPFNNFVEAASHHSRIVPVRLFLRFQFRSDLQLRKCTAPILITHGTKDNIVPYKLGLKLYQTIKANTRAEMLTIPNGKHGNLSTFPIMRARLNNFFDRYFAGS